MKFCMLKQTHCNFDNNEQKFKIQTIHTSREYYINCCQSHILIGRYHIGPKLPVRCLSSHYESTAPNCDH